MTDSSWGGADVRGQSSTLGIALVVGITLTAAVGIVVLGSAVLGESQQDSQIGQAEHALTQFDSKAAQVALGDSETTTVVLGRNGGTYRVEEDVGRIKLVHEDWNGTDESYADDENPHDIYNETLGAVVYENEDVEIGYQAGGVWRKDGEGAATMVSPPEFHYRDATLTLPVVRVDGTGAASGQSRAEVDREETAKDVFPRSETYPDGDREFANPITDGNVTVILTSEYCEGWESYFRDRTDGRVTECDEGTVEADLITIGTQGSFSPTGDEELDIRGFEEATEFGVSLVPSDRTSSGFNNIEWSMHGGNETHQFEVFVDPQGNGNDLCDTAVNLVVYYSDDGGESYHTWRNTDDVTIECPGGDALVNIDFNSDMPMTYEDHGGSLGEYDTSGDFEGDETLGGESYSESETTDLDNVTNAYLGRMGDVTLDIDEGVNENANSGLSASHSSGVVTYTGDSDTLAFLHVTENRIQVELSA